jgi:MFS family permease
MSPQSPDVSGEIVFYTAEKGVKMSDTKSKSAYILTIVIAILSLIATAGGLLSSALYRDNFLVTSGWRGNDLVTLFIAVPLLALALVLAWRGSPRARLVWLGMLDYTLYNFAFYLFGTAFNRFFLIYVALFMLSIFALIFGLVQTDVQAIGRQFRDRTPVKWISGYMLFVAAGLTTVYTIQSLGFITTGQLPPIVTLTGHPTNVVFALDLSLVVPVLVLGAIWLWQRRPWGYVLAVIGNVKGAVYMMALAATTITAVQSGAAEGLSQVGLWVFIGASSLIASLVLLWDLRPHS